MIRVESLTNPTCREPLQHILYMERADAWDRDMRGSSALRANQYSICRTRPPHYTVNRTWSVSARTFLVARVFRNRTSLAECGEMMRKHSWQ